jgi:hypothetical protein
MSGSVSGSVKRVSGSIRAESSLSAIDAHGLHGSA